MTCEAIERELVGYHFNVLGEAARVAVETHLPGCPACTRAFVALKRGIETAEDVPSPPASTRARVRDAVARELGLAEPRWSWWERPLALALAASVVLVAGMTTHALISAEGGPPVELMAPR